MKIYAKQVPPEYQESPLFCDDEFFPDNIAVYGNRDFKPHFTGVFDELSERMMDAMEVWDDMQRGDGYTETWADVLNDYLPPVGRGSYTRAERQEWPLILIEYGYNAGTGPRDAEFMARAASLITGQEYHAGTIRGCCQGDWQTVIYPAEYGRDWLEAFETEYFNTGTEWIIHDGDEKPEDPDDISGPSIYCHGWNTEQIKREIADASGDPDAEVQLYEFTEWTRTATYSVA